MPASKPDSHSPDATNPRRSTRVVPTSKRPLNESEEPVAEETQPTKKAKFSANPKTNPAATTTTEPPLNPKGGKKKKPTASTAETPSNEPPAYERPLPAPGSKARSKSQKPVPASTATPATPTAIPPVPSTEAQDPSSVEQAEENANKKAVRKKKSSAIAHKVSEQEEKKQHERDAKVQRQVEKGKKKAIDETPEETREFLERVQHEDGFSKNSVPHIKIQEATTPLNKKARQKENKKRTAQLLLQRYLASTPPLSQTETASESTDDSRPNSKREKGHPGRDHSRAGSQQPSTRASSLQPSTRGNSVQPSTRTGSPTPSLSSGDDDDNLPNLDLSEYLNILPVHLAPCITAPLHLNPPLRDPQRVSTIVELNTSAMSAKERTAYRKLLKLPLKGVREGDRAVVSGALSRFESLVLTHDPFPSDDNFRRLAGHANVWSCKKSAQVNLQMLPNSPYEDLMYSRIPNMRSAIVKNAAHETPMAYGFKPVNNENIQFNQDLATRLLDSAMFTCISFEEPGSFYENPVFVQIIRRSWFATASGCGPSHKDLWEYITIPCLALIATGVERVLMKYQRGDSDKLKFTTVDFKPKYVSHVVTLVEMFKLDGPHLEDHCRQMAIDLMKPFKATAIPVRLIAPRIPLHLITSHYKRSGLSQEQPKPPAARRAPPSSSDAGASGWSSSSNTHTRASKPAPQRPEVPKAGYASDGMDEPELWREGMEEGLPPTRFAQLLKQIGSDSDEEAAKPIAKAPPPRTKEEAIAMALKEWAASQRTSTSTSSAEVSAAGASGISGLRRRPIVAKDAKEEEEPSEDEGEMDVQEKAADDDSRRGAEAMDVDDDDDESDGEGRSGGAVKQVAEDVAMSDVGSVGTGESWDGE